MKRKIANCEGVYAPEGKAMSRAEGAYKPEGKAVSRAEGAYELEGKVVSRAEGAHKLEGSVVSRAEAAARVGNIVLAVIAAVLILVMLLYGGYSLWDTVMIQRSAFDMSELMEFKPSGGETNPTLYELQQQNPDVRAWITIDDTNIDYPVVQGEDDMEYINKDVYGEFFQPGSIFLSCQNSPDFSDSYNLLYGHHMRNGGMFGDVAEFVNNEYFNTHKTGTLYLPEGTHQIELFACVKTDAFDNVIYNLDQYDEENLNSLISHIKSHAVQYRDINMKASDSVIGLSTCSETETNGRIIVYGRLVK